jgi:hypothetical protein
MANAGYLATNIDQNVRIAHGVGVFFKRTGTTTWVDLGDLGDVAITPEAEFLEHYSNRKGQNAFAKRLLTTRGISIDATLNEINPDNLRKAFFAGAASSGSINVLETATPELSGSTFTLTETPDEVVSVVSVDGGTTYTVTTDYTVSGAVITVVTSSALDVDTSDGDKVLVTYKLAHNFGSDGTQKHTLLSDTDVTGSLQFQIRNNAGGLEQVYELTLVSIAPNGTISLGVGEIQSLPVSMKAQEVNGEFGTLYVTNI